MKKLLLPVLLLILGVAGGGGAAFMLADPEKETDHIMADHPCGEPGTGKYWRLFWQFYKHSKHATSASGFNAPCENNRARRRPRCADTRYCKAGFIGIADLTHPKATAKPDAAQMHGADFAVDSAAAPDTLPALN